MDDTNTERSRTHLVVGTSTSNKDLDTRVDELLLVLFQSANDALECRSDIGEVGDTTTDDENLALRTRGTTGDQVDCERVSRQ